MFSKYHYLNKELNKSARCYCLTVNNRLAGFLAVIMFPHPKQPYRKVHRLVILPDFQGIGLGMLFLNYIASITKDYPFAITTSQPALIYSLKNSPNWICKMQTRGSKVSKSGISGMNKTASIKRIVTTFVHKGQ